MTDLFPNKAIRNETIEQNGLRFYPITMSHYEEYQSCRLALLLRQSTLPATYAQMAFLNAVYALELDSIEATQSPTGLFGRLIAVLALSLKVDLAAFDLIPAKDPRQLECIRVRQQDITVLITPRQFDKIRAVVATQNGDTLPNEAENPELIRAEAEYAAVSAMPTEYSFENMLDSVAYNSGLRITELFEWTIRDFELRRKTIRRDKLFQIYMTAEMSGMVKFTKGNPYPSHEFDRAVSTPSVLQAESAVLHRFGQTAEIKK